MQTKDILRELRTERGAKQSTIASDIGIAQGTYSAYENGKIPPTEACIKISKYFGVSVDYLLGLTRERNPYSGTLDKSVNALSQAAGEAAPIRSSLLALLDAAMVYYRQGAPCGDVPLDAFNGFIHGLRGAMLAAAQKDDAALIDSANAATVAALEIAKMPALYYKTKGDLST